ncbi:carboxypeptidase regulatory-like domain-containing protein [Calycomorphotria hydatis]|nr:carboxypeptidase regulatory-like domain-containing protein [Calycomorphotria hydatis]
MKMVPVSGTITVNGKPAAHVYVRFKPVPQEGVINTGPTSEAFTDEQGRFTLHSTVGDQRSGAVPGTHKVVIWGKESQERVWQWGIEDPDSAPPPGQKSKQVLQPPSVKIPRGEKLSFIVPDDGTDEADFDF